MKFKVMFNFLLYKRCILTERERTKTTPDKTLPDKRSPDKTPQTKSHREQVRHNLYKGAFVRVFCTKPSENRGGPRCVTYFRGVPGCVTRCDRGGKNWSKIA